MNVAHEEIDLKNPKQIEEMQVLPMKKEINLQNYYRRALQIVSDIYIRTPCMPIPGGLIVPMPEK